MAVTVSQGQATNAVKVFAGGGILFAGTKSGTTTLTPQISLDGGSTWFGLASPTDYVTPVSYTESFPAVTLEVPKGSTDPLFRLANTSGAGSWSVHGPFASAAAA